MACRKRMYCSHERGMILLQHMVVHTMKPCTFFISVSLPEVLHAIASNHVCRFVKDRDLHEIRCIEKAGKHLVPSLVPRPFRPVLIACSMQKRREKVSCVIHNIDVMSLCLYLQPSLVPRRSKNQGAPGTHCLHMHSSPR